MKLRIRNRALEETGHPITRQILAEDVPPGTKHDQVIQWAMRATRTGDPAAFEAVGRLLAPLLVKPNPAPLRALAMGVVGFHAHKPQRDRLLELLNKLAMRDTVINGIGKPMPMRDIMAEIARSKAYTKTGAIGEMAALEQRIRRLAPLAGLPIEGETGRPRKATRSPAKLVR